MTDVCKNEKNDPSLGLRGGLEKEEGEKGNDEGCVNVGKIEEAKGQAYEKNGKKLSPLEEIRKKKHAEALRLNLQKRKRQKSERFSV